MTPKHREGPGGVFLRAAPKYLQKMMEAVVLLIVVFMPWAYGCVHALFQLFLACGLAVLLGLCALRIALERQVTWASCPVLICLAGMFVLGVWQVFDLPQPLLERVSPGTDALRRELLPQTPEEIGSEPGQAISDGTSQHTISLYPGATRAELVGWLAIVALFWVVRNYLASTVFLYQLAVVAVANGAALALFGLLQYFSSPRHMLYWSLPTLGTVFGAFINRNHFAAYTNLTIGLAIGLLLSKKAESLPLASQGVSWTGKVRMLLRPQILSVGLALTLMLAAVVICLSRGGLVALLVASLVCLVLFCWRSRRLPRMLGTLLVGIGATALVVWLAWPAVAARLGTLWQGEAARESRVQLWARLMPLWHDFPVWGSGYGTLAYVEPLQRQPGQERGIYYDHADNDYVQILVEGGTVGLILTATIVVLVFVLGCRAFLFSRTSRLAGLALGGLFAWVTIMVHSFLDYGMHIPAVAVLATVLAAHLAALHAGGSKMHQVEPRGPGHRVRHLGGLAPLLAGGAATAVAFVLVHEAWCAAGAERYRLAAVHCKVSTDSAAQARRRSYLQAAVTLAPDNAGLQLELAEAYHDAFERDLATLPAWTATYATADLAGAGGNLTLAGSGCFFPALASSAFAVSGPLGRDADRSARKRASDSHLTPALQGFVRARNLCPLLGHPHVRLGTYANLMAAADARQVYLRRAARVMPHDERIWFACGARALEEGSPQEAWPCWRRCLQCSPRFLASIVLRSRHHLTIKDMVQQVLPPDPQALFDAALILTDQSESAATGPVLLAQALRLADERAAQGDVNALYLRARCHQLLGHQRQALQAYRELRDRAPGMMAWRLQFIELLCDAGQLHEARRDLVELLQLDPRNPAAKELYKSVVEKLSDRD
jgi:O-antigen ligase/tetratricopeptide (TPR) repeat protein